MALNYFFGIDIEKLKTRIDEMENSFGQSEKEEVSLETSRPEEKKEEFFFEGAEKLLEIWFTTKNRHGNESDLRSIPRSALEKMLLIAKCEIISFMSNAEIDAYVLSESSLFVSKRRIILKTCGTTTPLNCIERIVWLVQTYTAYDMIEDAYYSRKNFKRPELQYVPHRTFEQEVNILDKYFLDGGAYCMGNMNKDCWYMYTLNPIERYVTGKAYVDNDQTIEILMSDLDMEVMNIFFKSSSVSADQATKKSGINKLVPGMKIDSCLFEPCGYSMNAILDDAHCSGGLGDYATIHVTPEVAFSYVSFETNRLVDNYMELIKQVVNTFKPGKLMVTFYATRVGLRLVLSVLSDLFNVETLHRRPRPSASMKN